jgi:hypothetical protein
MISCNKKLKSAAKGISMWNVAISIYDIYDGAFHLFQII